MKVRKIDYRYHTNKVYYSVESEDDFYKMEAWGRENNVGIHYHANSSARWIFQVTGDLTMFLLRWK